MPSSQLFSSKAIYYRLLVPYMLEHGQTMLYLDADIVCLNTFTDFYNSRKNFSEIALVVSEKENLAPTLAANIGLKGSNYFNSGMLLINVERWLQENISYKTMLILESQGYKFKYFDQDALNILIEDKVRFVDKKYNLIFKLKHKKDDYKLMPPIDTVFLHYAGADKPWQKWNKQSATKFYTNIYLNFPWSSKNFDIPKNYEQAKKMYKLMLHKREYISCLRWYLSYIKFRYNK